MKTLLTVAAVVTGLALMPAAVQAGGGHHGHGHHGHGHHGHDRWNSWGHHDHHRHHHHGSAWRYRPAPIYRVQPYPYYPYSGGISIGTPRVWIHSGW